MNDYTYETEEQVIEAGERFQRARYWQHVRDIAEEALAEHPGRDDDGGERDDFIHESVDSDQYVIYTAKNLLVMRYTENDDAYTDAYGEELKGVAGAIYQTIAFFAMRADVNDEVDRLLEEHGNEEEPEGEED